MVTQVARSDRFSIKDSVFFEMPIPIPQIEEQRKIGEHLTQLDLLITLHPRELFYTKMHLKPAQVNIIHVKGEDNMPELESMIEKKLIEQLVYGDSQWTYRDDLKTEEDLWANFKYILEQNNKDRLNGEKSFRYRV